MKSTSADASESRQPGLALLSYFPETNKDLSCAVELNFTIGSEVAESEPLEVDPNFKFHDEDRAKKSCTYIAAQRKRQVVRRRHREDGSATDARAAIFVYLVCWKPLFFWSSSHVKISYVKHAKSSFSQQKHEFQGARQRGGHSQQCVGRRGTATAPMLTQQKG